MRKTISAAGVILGIALIAGCAASSPGTAAKPAVTHQAASPSSGEFTQVTGPTSSPAPAPSTQAPGVTRVHFYVTGTGEPSIDYGSDADSRQPGHLGILSDGNALPWHSSMRFDGAAQFYDIDAQLEGPGDITCKIVVTGPGVVPLTVASGHAQSDSDGAICSAQASPDDATGSSWTPEG